MNFSQANGERQKRVFRAENIAYVKQRQWNFQGSVQGSMWPEPKRDYRKRRVMRDKAGSSVGSGQMVKGPICLLKSLYLILLATEVFNRNDAIA